MGLLRRRDSGCVVSGKESALKLSRPVEKLGDDQGRVSGEMRLDFGLVVVPVVETSKAGGQASQHPDQAQLRLTIVSHQAKACFCHESEAILRFCLHFG